MDGYYPLPIMRTLSFRDIQDAAQLLLQSGEVYRVVGRKIISGTVWTWHMIRLDMATDYVVVTEAIDSQGVRRVSSTVYNFPDRLLMH